MNPNVKILLGPARSGKTARMLNRYADRVRGGEGGNVLLLLPTALAVDQVKWRLVSDGLVDGLFNPHIVEFYGLVNRIIAHNVRDAREISHAEQHAILHRILNELNSSGSLEYFSSSLVFSGFITALQGFVTDLKEAMLEPDEFLKQVSSGVSKEGELALIYKRYQDFLADNSLYDSQGKLWRAGQLIREGAVAPCQDLREMLIDGFADFTPSEFDILKSLGERCERVTFTLMCETDNRRRSLFDSTLITLQLIRNAFKNASIENIPSVVSSKPLSVLEAQIFDDAATGRSKNDGIVEIAGYPSRTSEVVEVGRRIKRTIIEEGRSPSDILVLVRRLGVYDGLVQEIFCEQGIPLYIHGKRPISRVAGLRPAIQLARLPLDGYSRAAVCRFLKSVENRAAGFRDMENPAEVLDLCAREAGIVGGLNTWRDRLESYKARLQKKIDAADGSDSFDEKDLRQALPYAEKAIETAKMFFEGFENLERPRPLSEYAAAFLNLIERFELFETPLAKKDTGADTDSHTAASDAIESLARELGKIARLPGGGGGKAAYGQFYNQFHAILAVPLAWSRGDRSGTVTLADISVARNTSYPVVFILGMSEGEFPRPVLQNAFLDDSERRRLNIAGGPGLQESAEEQKKEMPLFYTAVTRAREKLILTYPAMSTSGREVRQSWYLDEVEKIFEDLDVERSEVSRAAPPESLATNRREAAIAAVALAQSIDGPPPDYCCPPVLDAASLADKISVCRERDSLRPFGHYDGVLDDTKAVAVLRDELESAVFSSNKISEYLQCPFNYFCKKVLGLKELPVPTNEMPPLESGSHYHAILRLFYSARARDNADAAAVTPGNIEEALEQLSEICRAYLDGLAAKGVVRHPGIFAVERGQIADNLRKFIEFEANHNKDAPGRPSYFETAFGFEKFIPEWDSASVHKTLDIQCGGITARIRGVIDRIDICGNDSNKFTVIDYKQKNAPTKSPVMSGKNIQLQIYVLAAERLLLKGLRPGRAFFFKVTDPARSAILKADGEDSSMGSAIDAAGETIAQCLHGIAGGRFQPVPADTCAGYCPCSGACRYDMRRIEKKR